LRDPLEDRRWSQRDTLVRRRRASASIGRFFVPGQLLSEMKRHRTVVVLGRSSDGLFPEGAVRKSNSSECAAATDLEQTESLASIIDSTRGANLRSAPMAARFYA
jgi:hypothetical protein